VIMNIEEIKERIKADKEYEKESEDKKVLTLFILNSGRPGANAFKTQLSLRGLVKNFYVCANNHEIMQRQINTPWYMVLYDNEVLDEQAKEALPTFFELGKSFDFISFYKRGKIVGNKFHICPRVFQKHVKLSDEGLLPINFESLNGTPCLNGFVKEFGENVG